MIKEKMTPEQIESVLAHYYGTENWYRWPFGGFSITDGVKAMAEMCGAFWLIDAIVVHQKVARKACGRIQFWTFKREGTGGILTCVRDTGETPCVEQNIPYTDFPLNEIRLYVADGGPDGRPVCLLPSEY